MFFGQETVLADLRLHKDQAGLVTTGTLSYLHNGVYSDTTVAYANVCLWPGTGTTGLGRNGTPVNTSLLTAWRTGESRAPQPQGKWTVGGTEYLIDSVTVRLNADAGYAVYDCQVSRPAAGSGT